ncbi:Ig domain-containing protein [Leucobacter komagatae]|uniref:Uncharacterized protein n=1 Tax=Leucobacter komagatae TaxID=55969 RepID=A0A0D0H6H3_9MICO|nr:Ig domain-containing protein [Leucobacter komagatae]KIP52785.1 hypothetical protein SD72_07535 [Leucobacter komagatae]
MHTNLKQAGGASLVAGLLLFGSVATPATAAPDPQPRPLVEEVDGLESPEAIVLSADSTTLFALGSWAEGAAIDVATREITGTIPAIPDLDYAYSRPTQAIGPKYAVATADGYTLVTLATGAQERFTLDPRPGETRAPVLQQVVIGASGKVTAITQDGEFLELDGDSVTASQRIRDADLWSQRNGTSADGALYFESFSTLGRPYEDTTVVLDLETGAQLLSIVRGEDEPDFLPAAFDASGTSLWGLDGPDQGVLTNVDIATGAELGRTTFGSGAEQALFADASQEWFVMGGNPISGGTLAPDATLGARELNCCTSAFMRLPGNGDVVYFDTEMRRVGFITAPSITDPEDAPIAAMGETVKFTSPAEGLALREDEAGAVPGAGAEPTIGSVWQSSADGVAWDDLPGETGETLTLEATADSYPLEYRRHFFDPFWGTPKSSAPARMVGVAPEITRADDLPNGTAGATYPGQTITATGQPDLAWSSTDLPATLTLDPGTGELTGTTDAAGEYEFTVTVTDAFGTDSKLFHLRVSTDDATLPPVLPPGPGEPTGPEVPPAPPVGDELPATGGANWLPAAALGAALLAAGVAGLLVSRRLAHASAGHTAGAVTGQTE